MVLHEGGGANESISSRSVIKILPYYEGLTLPGLEVGRGSSKMEKALGTESYWGARIMILASLRKMKLHRRDRGKCLHAVNKESQGNFLFLFSQQDAGWTLDGRGLLLWHWWHGIEEMQSGRPAFQAKNNAFRFPNEKLELDLRMIIGLIHWYMPTLLPEPGPNHTYLQQSCCLSCRLSTVGESKPVFRWYPELDSGRSLGSAMNSRPHF